MNNQVNLVGMAYAILTAGMGGAETKEKAAPEMEAPKAAQEKTSTNSIPQKGGDVNV